MPATVTTHQRDATATEAKSGVNPALSRNCDPLVGKPGRLTLR